MAELVDALDSKSSFFGSVGSIPTQGTDKQLQGSPEGAVLIKIKAHQALLVWAFVFYQMHRRSLALKLFSKCSQWEDGLCRPSSPTHKLEWVFFNIRLVSKSDRHPDGSLLRNQSGIRQG